MRFTIFQESRKGGREINQDRIAYTYSRATLLLVIADGMGGGDHRGKQSQLVALGRIDGARS